MKLHLKNFRCYDDITFDFSEKGITLISGNSGTGKSTILIAIHFALYGVGKKIVQYGKSSCSVELIFNDLTILRTKKPNRLLVNSIHEDQSGQEIINEKFGEMFDSCGYISQNAINSFVIMSPTDKLEFIEQFAFKDIDLSKIKNKTKALISERHDNLLETTSKLKLSTDVLQSLKKPVEVIFPIKCSSSNREKVIQNEAVKLKNCYTLLKKSDKKLKSFQEEINDTNLFLTSMNQREEIIYEIKKKITILENEKSRLVPFCGEKELKKYQDKLNILISNREYIVLQKEYNTIQENLKNIKDTEKKILEDEIEKINTTLWKEYDKETIDNNIEYYEKYYNDLQQIKNIETENDKISYTNVNKINEYKEKLKKYKDELNVYNNQKNLHSCPSCESKLKIINNKLFLCDNYVDIKIDEQATIKQISILTQKINECESNNTKKKNNEELIKQIKDGYKKEEEKEEDTENCLDDIADIKNNLEYMKEYKRENISFEEKLRNLKMKLCNENFGKVFENETYKANDAKNKLQKAGNDVKNMKNDFNKLEINDFSEDDLREILNRETSNKNKLDNLCNNIKNFMNDIENHDKKNNETKTEFLKKYESVKDLEELKKNIEDENNIIKEIETKKDNLEQNKILIEKYNTYHNELKYYNEWNDKVKTFTEQEKKDRNLYVSANLLKEKIMEAESIAMVNIISCINAHSQMYIEEFFPDVDINIKLVPFKETKKSKKPQINIEVEYKNMDFDLCMLSGGQLARVILAYTLALGEMFNVPIIMLDECTSSLDESTTEIVFETIKKKFSEKSVLVIAHQIVTGSFDKVIKL